MSGKKPLSGSSRRMFPSQERMTGSRGGGQNWSRAWADHTVAATNVERESKTPSKSMETRQVWSQTESAGQDQLASAEEHHSAKYKNHKAVAAHASVQDGEWISMECRLPMEIQGITIKFRPKSQCLCRGVSDCIFIQVALKLANCNLTFMGKNAWWLQSPVLAWNFNTYEQWRPREKDWLILLVWGRIVWKRYQIAPNKK